MISQIHIKNFKSIVDLTLDLGRVNLFIGENGSGKSNILEAVAFASSTSNDWINNILLASKGVRNTKPELYSNAFYGEAQYDIHITAVVNNHRIGNHYVDIIFKFDANENNWENINPDIYSHDLAKFLLTYSNYLEYKGDSEYANIEAKNYFDLISIKKNTPDEIKNFIEKSIIQFKDNFSKGYENPLSDFIIYSPEVSFLRKFEEEGQVKPLGAHGEGLFSLLKSIAKENGSLQHIKENMEVIDWFEDFSIPHDLMSNEYKISIKDRFINSELKYLDQRSANEGFLFLLFYIVLFSSKRTPQFFAIDNIEASFNPKLCSKLINMLVDLSKKNNKQVLMTTHNPATLDGLDLKDPEQRLFVVKRNIDGHTIVTRISEKPNVTPPMKLSEMWVKNFLGGLPDNF